MKTLGRSYLLQNNLDIAESLYLKSLHIFQDKEHPDVYMIFENLAELYKKLSDQKKETGDLQQSKIFKVRLQQQTINYLKQALKIVKAYFPEDSPHVTRIQEKLKSLE